MMLMLRRLSALETCCHGLTPSFNAFVFQSRQAPHDVGQV